MPAKERAAGLADEVALARRDAKARGNRHLGLALALVKEMPNTFTALALGDISEWRATILVRETAVLSVEDRREVDARLANRMPRLGDRALGNAARALAYELDPASVRRRTRGAVADRRVTIRPAPDTMSMLTGFLPAAQGAAAYGALRRHARARRTAGDPRSEAQIMADTLVERLTGQATAAAVPVAVHLVMTDQALFGTTDTAAHLVGYGPIPASCARDLLNPHRITPEPQDSDQHTGGQDTTGPTTTAATTGDGITDISAWAQVWLRRPYTDPDTGALVAMDSRRRLFDGHLRRFLILRDQLCRTPWCDAPIRHADHIHPAAHGGETTAANGQGLCERCNHTKQLPGWHTDVVSDTPGEPPETSPLHTVVLTTPAGHAYYSTPPPTALLPPSRHPVRAGPTPVQIRLAAHLGAA